VHQFNAKCDTNLALVGIGGYYRGRKIYEPPRYMSVNTAVEQLLEIEEKRQENGKSNYSLTQDSMPLANFFVLF
jgi:hypothetical protein